MTARRIAIIGPPGSGKTENAQALMNHFGVFCLIDSWDGKSSEPQMFSTCLALTNATDIDRSLVDQVMSIDEALLELEQYSQRCEQCQFI